MADEDVTPEEETPAEEETSEEKPKRKRRTSRSKKAPEEPCDNHPDRESVWASDGVTASVVRYCKECEERYT